MPILQYETRVAADGTITLPPEYCGRKVVVSVDKEVDQTRFDALEEKYGPFDDGWRPDPAAVRQLLENRRFTVEMTDEEMEELKRERRMRKML